MGEFKKTVKRTATLILAFAMVLATLVVTPVSTEAAKKGVKVSKVTVVKPTNAVLVLKKGQTYTLKTKVSVKPDKKTNRKVIYRSSSKKVARVNSKGKIVAVKAGKAVITVLSKKNPKKKDTIIVRVGTPVKKLVLNATVKTICVGETFKIATKSITPKKATYKKVTFSSTNKSIAKVDSKTGLVTGVAKGDTKIIALAKDGSGKKAICKLSVIEKTEDKTNEVPVTSLTISGAPSKICVGEKVHLGVKVIPENATVKDVCWSVEPANLATISDKGDFTAGSKQGTVTVIATSKSQPSVKTTSTITIQSDDDDSATRLSVDLSCLAKKNDVNPKIDYSGTLTSSENDSYKFNVNNQEASVILDMGKAYDLSDYRMVEIIGKSTSQIEVQLYADSLNMDDTSFAESIAYGGQCRFSFQPFFEGTHAFVAGYGPGEVNGVKLTSLGDFRYQDKAAELQYSTDGSLLQGDLTNIRYIRLTTVSDSDHTEPFDILIQKLSFVKGKESDVKVEDVLSMPSTITENFDTSATALNTVKSSNSNSTLGTWETEDNGNGYIRVPGGKEGAQIFLDNRLGSTEKVFFVYAKVKSAINASTMHSVWFDVQNDYSLNGTCAVVPQDTIEKLYGRALVEDWKGIVTTLKVPAGKFAQMVIRGDATFLLDDITMKEYNPDTDSLVVERDRYWVTMPNSCSLLSSTNEGYSVSDGGIVCTPKNGDYYTENEEVMKLTIPNHVALSSPSDLFLDVDYYSDGQLVTLPTKMKENDIAYRFISDTTVNPELVVYQQDNMVQSGGYHEEVPESVQDIDFYAGKGALAIYAPCKTHQNIDKIVVKKVMFIDKWNKMANNLIDQNSSLYSTAEEGYIYQTEADSFYEAGSEVARITIPADEETEWYDRFRLNFSYYNDGVLVTEPTDNYDNDFTFEIYEDLSVDNAIPIYQQPYKVRAGGYIEVLNDAVKNADFSSGKGGIILRSTAKSHDKINKVVIKDVGMCTVEDMVKTELVRTNNVAYNSEAGGLLYTFSNEFSPYEIFCSLAIPSNIDMNDYDLIGIDFDYYVDGVKMEGSVEEFSNVLFFEIMDDDSVQNNDETTGHVVYQQLNHVQSRYTENLNDNAKDGDYSNGHGVVRLGFKPETSEGIDKVVVKSVRFEASES